LRKVRAYDGPRVGLSTRLAARRRRAHVAVMAAKDKEREERLAAALRENLRRRKAQARSMVQAEKEPDDRS
jgi:hypothetical protein